MKTPLMLGLGALTVAAVAVAFVPLQDAKAKTRGDEKAAHAAGDSAAMMEAFMKAGAPGKQHAEFKQLVGTWETHSKNWMDPTQPPQEGHGTSTFEMAMGDRFLVEHYSGDGPGGAPMTGMGISAYNNVSGEYENVWLDSMGTGLFVTRGTAAADGTVTYKGEMDNPMGGPKMPCRMVLKTVSANERHFEMWCSMGGPESKSMEITYTRPAASR